MNNTEIEQILIKLTLDKTQKERDKALKDLKKTNLKLEKSIEIINMITSKIDIKKLFTKNECDTIQNYIYIAMNNF
tara:strand:- start:979 stop:1206 length:228 start_codon:yes stop_codon:yes gene_type:complete